VTAAIALVAALGAAAAPGVQAGTPPEIVREIRVHGNAYLTDAEVLAVAGVTVGDPIGADTITAIEKRLKDSGRFETIEIRKRNRSLTDPSDVALVLIVHEKPGVRSASAPTEPIYTPWRRFRSRLMFLPILTYADGYGFTYGARFSTMNVLGAGERLSVPLTWGGTRRAALELERTFRRGPLTRVESSVAIWNRENPRFEIRDQRVELAARAERVFAGLFRAGVEASRSTIEFGALDDRLWTFGATAALDTRGDPAYPANAIYLGTGWTGMHFRSVEDRVNRYAADGRGYLRVRGQTVLAARAVYTTADRPLPAYERLLLGGSSSVRGFETGAFDGDRTLAASIELRHPVTSVLSGSKLGVNLFFDAGRAWDAGGRFEDAAWRRGAGAGLFLIASVVRINLDVAHGFRTGDTRVHLSSGFTF
jgi:outer membrane protein assembly factor BamA